MTLRLQVQSDGLDDELILCNEKKVVEEAGQAEFRRTILAVNRAPPFFWLFFR